MPEPSSGNEPRPPRSLDDETPLTGQSRYEELYRPGGDGAHPGQHPLRPPRPRHFERPLQAPEQPDPDDTFGWLFRDSIRQPPAPRTGPEPGADAYPMWGEAPETIGEPSTEETRIRPALDPTPTRLTNLVAPDQPSTEDQSGSAVQSHSEVQSHSDDQGSQPGEYAAEKTMIGEVPGLPEAMQPQESSSYLTDDVSEQARRRWPLILIGGAVGLVLVSILVLVLVFVFWGDDDADASGPTRSEPRASESAPSETESDPPADEPEQGPYEGEVAAVSPTGATAECVADPAKDASGAEVRYDPDLALDDDPNTAWRCAGDGAGQELVLTLPEGTTVAEVGLVNGYTKTDPADGADRYPEYRRITAVTWTFDDGSTVAQDLADDERELQVVRVPPVQTSTVTLTIDASAEPGSTEASRDAVLVSSVAVSAPQ